MAGQKLFSQYSEETSPSGNDALALGKSGFGTGSNKWTRINSIVSSVGLAKLGTQQSFTKSQTVSTVTLTDGSTISVDASLGNVFKVTLGGSRTLANPTNLTDGQTILLIVIQDGTGSRTLSYGTNYDFGTDGAPTLTITASKKDILSFVSDGTKMYFCGIKQGFS